MSSMLQQSIYHYRYSPSTQGRDSCAAGCPAEVMSQLESTGMWQQEDKQGLWQWAFRLGRLWAWDASM